MSRQIWKPGTMIYPLPAVLVSMGDFHKQADFNMVTVAWTGTLCTNPAMAYISLRPERYSYNIIKKYGNFVINVTTEELAKATDFCGVKSGRDIDKFEHTGLTPIKSTMVSAPSVKESPISIECIVKDILPLGSHHMFLSEVLSVSADESLMDNTGKFHLDKAKPLIYSHGKYYGTGKSIGGFGFSVKKKKKDTK
ncbi:flavin reductase family protein [Anaeropeptidivorans aminofermentans]|uniref:flavin reductase family protein n=1 Tax=Anaeropeptidivorans aminofermentans TaxID=2934315 RepID=UPI0020243433|nr:flavin reductase family protein [Anaeropeptidivorans aminofermentans]MBE6012050.1 flavin reductase family protein [Lachnospiraceae bacterium]